MGGGGQECAECGKTVYVAEAIYALDTVFHKSCFKCSFCKTALNQKVGRPARVAAPHW